MFFSKSIIAAVFTCALATFAMNFGAGNVVFPLLVGVSAGQSSLVAGAGLMVSDVLLTFLGMLGLIFFSGSPHRFLAPLGVYPAKLFFLIIVLLMGPLGIAPRCITVSLGAIEPLLPGIPVALFSLIYCLLLAYILVHPGKLIHRVGNIMTPALLFAIGVLVYKAFSEPATGNEGVFLSSSNAFYLGFEQGFQTLDAIGSFVAVPVLYAFLRQKINSEALIARACILASFLGMVLLGCVYAGMIYIGSKHAALMQGVSPTALFVDIAGIELGEYAAITVATIIVLACLTTVVVAVNFFSDYLQTEILKTTRKKALTLTLVATYIVSLVGFGDITKLLAQAMDLLYPTLIALIFFNFGRKIFERPDSSDFRAFPRFSLAVNACFMLVLLSTVLYRLGLFNCLLNIA